MVKIMKKPPNWEVIPKTRKLRDNRDMKTLSRSVDLKEIHCGENPTGWCYLFWFQKVKVNHNNLNNGVSVEVVIWERILKQELMNMKNHKTNPGNVTLDSSEPQKRAKAPLLVVVKMKASPGKEIRTWILKAERRTLNNLPSQPSVIPQGALTSLSK